MDKPSDDVRAGYEAFFAEQIIHNADLYKWGALWVFWQAAYQAGIASKQDGWISVKDGLPACGQPVVLMNINKFENCSFVEDRNLQDAGYLAGPEDAPPSMNNWWSVRGQRALAIDAYTHWMPLPESQK